MKINLCLALHALFGKTALNSFIVNKMYFVRVGRYSDSQGALNQTFSCLY